MVSEETVSRLFVCVNLGSKLNEYNNDEKIRDADDIWRLLLLCLFPTVDDE